MSGKPPDESNSTPREGSGNQNPPTAIVRSADSLAHRRLKTRLWWLSGLCLALALGLVVSSLGRRGLTIHVRFKDGYGLKPGDALLYRGIDCGRVSEVKLTQEMDGVDVAIVIHPGNEEVAVEGSQFWIQRARLSLGQVSGLDTVLGAKYVGVIPGRGQRRIQSFDGIETPLAMTEGLSSEIRVRFADGDGLNVGSPVRYRGVQVGEVTAVDLGDDLQSIHASIRLVGSAQQLAREGTQFWIERPRIELTEVRGLDTILGGSYVALQPGLPQSAIAFEFIGLTQPPPLAERSGTLEIELDATSRMGIVRGAPVVYRGLEVGRVVTVGLSKDSASVKITAEIDGQYVQLVREDSKWWAVGGIDFNAGMSGIDLSVESFSAWLRGGIAFATPPSPGKPVVTGHRFMLESKPLDEWLEWQPRIALRSSVRSSNGLPMPSAERVVASWTTSILGLQRRRIQKCWGLALSDGTLVLPNAFVDAITSIEDNLVLETSGTSFPFQSKLVARQGAISRHPLPADWPGEKWAIGNVNSSPGGDSTFLVVNPELTEPLALDRTRIQDLGVDGLRIAPGIPIAEQLNGSPVIDSASGQVIGMLSSTNNGWVVGQIPEASQSRVNNQH